MTTDAQGINTVEGEIQDGDIQSYDPKISGMLLRKAFCLLEKANESNIETERKRNLLKTIKY